MDPFERLQEKASTGSPVTRAEAEALLGSHDLVRLGTLAESSREVRSGARVTYGRVALVSADGDIAVGAAGEVRLEFAPTTVREAREAVRRAHAAVGPVPLTAFSLPDVSVLAGGDVRAMADLAAALVADGLSAVADLPVDGFANTDDAIAAVEAVTSAGLGVWRATLQRAEPAERLDFIERAIEIQRATRSLRALAPLPRVDAAEAPSTGYDDVRTVAIASLRAVEIPHIQVDWMLYGPKLAQVAVAFGANDIDAVAAVDLEQLGRRRSPKEDIERQIRAVGGVPAERDGRYQLRW